MSRVIFEREEDGRQVRLIGSADGDQELYIDGAWGLTVTSGGICKINLFTVAPETDGSERREVVARLAMPVRTLFALKDFIAAQCDRLIQEGVVGEQPRDVDSRSQIETEQDAE